MQGQIIQDTQSLEDLCHHIVETGWFSFDTEFVGEDRFQPEVCLIQVATEAKCSLIDPLAGLDVRPFWELIADDRIVVIVHAGSEDISQCRRETGQGATNVFDLQIAAGLLGHGYPISLARLTRKLTGRKVHKSQTLTNWRQRPLTAEQLRYAIDDVAHLRAMYEVMDRELISRGRQGWMREECAGLCRAAGRATGATLKIMRLKGGRSLAGRESAIACALLEVREELAGQYNRPVRAVLGDHLIVEIARHGLTDVGQIRSLRGINLNRSAVERLAAAVEAAKRLPRAQWPELPSQEDSPVEETLMALMTAVLRDFCQRNGIAYSLLARKQDLRTLIRCHTRCEERMGDHPFKIGWRKEAVGELLENILSGSSSVRVAIQGKMGGLSIE